MRPSSQVAVLALDDGRGRHYTLDSLLTNYRTRRQSLFGYYTVDLHHQLPWGFAPFHYREHLQIFSMIDPKGCCLSLRARETNRQYYIMESNRQQQKQHSHGAWWGAGDDSFNKEKRNPRGSAHTRGRDVRHVIEKVLRGGICCYLLLSKRKYLY